MSEIVVDTNVWCMAQVTDDEPVSSSKQQCIEACADLLTELQHHQHLLVIDDSYVILGEYRRNIRKGGFAWSLLNQLEQRGAYIAVTIQIDENGKALLPSELRLAGSDDDDWKFVAVALARDPHPPIMNATDRGWPVFASTLEEAGIIVEELCPDLLEQ